MTSIRIKIALVAIAALSLVGDVRAASCLYPASQIQTFQDGMVGCDGSVSQYTDWCAAGDRACTAFEYLARRGATVPTEIYHIGEALQFGSGTSGNCNVSDWTGTACAYPGTVRVCPPNGLDSNNATLTCGVYNCGFTASTPNAYFGGCTGFNPDRGGMLCCDTGDNRAGDSNLDRYVDAADRARAFDRLLGRITAAEISPLAVVGPNNKMGIDDVMLIAQKVSGVRTGLQPRPEILTIAGTSYGSTAVSGTTSPYYWFTITSSLADAKFTGGLDQMTVSDNSSNSNASGSSAIGIWWISTSNSGYNYTVAFHNPGPGDEVFQATLSVPLLNSEGGPAYTATGQKTITVTPPVCGDTICSQANGGTENCLNCFSDCNDNPLCGDGVICPGYEQCDDSNSNWEDDCLNTCQNNVCGDGFKDLQGPGLQLCDDANSSYFDDCRPGCIPNVCGDGYRNSEGPVNFEQCDDGNTNCYDACTCECKNAICGDGYLYPLNETCDIKTVDKHMYYLDQWSTDSLLPENSLYVRAVTMKQGVLAAVADEYNGANGVLALLNPSVSPPGLLGVQYFAEATVDVALSGQVAYVAKGYGGVSVVDITNPAAPTVLSSIPTTAYSLGVYVSGSRLFIADGANGLKVYNVGVPSAPVLLGTYNTAGTATDVFVLERRAYVADGASGLVILDVSGAVPSLLGTYDTPGYAMKLDVAKNNQIGTVMASIADNGPNYSGLSIDATNPAAPFLSVNYNLTAAVTDVVSYNMGRWAVAAGAAGPYVQGLAPVTPSPGNTTSLLLYGNRLYTGVDSAVLRYDFSDPCYVCQGAFPGDFVVSSGEACDSPPRSVAPLNFNRLEQPGYPCYLTSTCYRANPGPTHWWAANGTAGPGVTGTTIANIVGDDIGYDSASIAGQAWRWTNAETDDVVYLPNTAMNGLTNFTVSLWYKTTDNNASLLSAANASQTNELLIYVADTNFPLWIKGAQYNLNNSTVGYTTYDNRWHNLVVTRSGTIMSAYVDGEFKQSFTVSGAALVVDDPDGAGFPLSGLLLGQEQDAVAGGYDAAQTLNNGSIDEVSIYNVAMTASEITAAYDRVARHGTAHRCSDY